MLCKTYLGTLIDLAELSGRVKDIFTGKNELFSR